MVRWTSTALVAVCLAPSLLADDQQSPQQPPPPVVTTGGSGGGGSSAGGGAGGGTGGPAGGGGGGGGGALYDGYADIDWNGPDVVPNSPLIFDPFPVDILLDEFRAATAHLPGSVRRQDLTYQQALFNINGLIPGPGLEMIEQLKAESMSVIGSNHLENYSVAAGMPGRVDTMLAITLARHQASPQDPTILFNLASLLTQRGLVNEAVAMLDRLGASKSTPEAAFGYSPPAMLDYMRGYTALLRGELQVAQSLLQRSFNADRSIADASYALAVAQEALGGDPRKAFIEGFLMAYGGRPFMYCGAEEYEKDPLTTEEDQNVAPPTDEIFDLSKGTDGVLPQLPHPANNDQLAVMVLEVERNRKKIDDEFQAHVKRADALHKKLLARLTGPNPKPTDLTDEELMDRIDEANVCLKPLHRMKAQVDTVTEELTQTIQRSAELAAPRILESAAIRLIPASRAASRQIANDGIMFRRGAIQRWETAVRIRFKSWHKYSTGIAALMTDPEWQEYAKETIDGRAKAEWMGLYVGLVHNYGSYLPVVTEDAADSGQLLPDPNASQMALCNPTTQKGSIEVDLVKVPIRSLPITRPEIGISVEANCDKIAVEMDGTVGVGLDGVARIAAGGFAEASQNRGGDITIFSGPKLTGNVGATTGTVKDGVYVTFDSEGIKEVGTKVESAQRVGTAKLQTFDKGFVVWAAPPRPPRIDPKYGLAIWGEVK